MANYAIATTTTAVGTDASTADSGGAVVFQPPLGFGTAYGLGEPVWKSLSRSYALLTFITGEPALECFGPDADGNLVSLGTLAAGWVVTQGDVGSAGGAAREYSN